MVTFSSHLGLDNARETPHGATAQPGEVALRRDNGLQARQPARLDEHALAQLSELDPTGENRLLERVLKTFQDSVARLGPQLDVARRDGDLTTIRLVAHTFKSSSASIGALALSSVCAQIEAAVQTHDEKNLPQMLIAFDLALDASLSAICPSVESLPMTARLRKAVPPDDDLPGQPKVLLVDDDEVNLLLTSVALREHGFEVTEANGGSQAIGLLSELVPDVVVLDALMPGLDGFDTCRNLRVLSGFESMPVLMLTGLRRRRFDQPCL